MQEAIDIDKTLIGMDSRFMLGSIDHMAPTEEEKAQMTKVWAELREQFKDTDLKIVLPDVDFSSLEERAAAFAADSLLWDDRVLGAEEEYVEVCSDPELLALVRQSAQERSKEKKDVVVLGAGPGLAGGFIGALTSFATMERRMLADNIVHIDLAEEKMMKPSFLDERSSKLRKGRGHNKFKKGKKK
ncbi:hypothetical protein Hena1_02220 [Erwinia phage Hena1]|uniref:Uncharacterized protein n=1 Tax=Erwinia phage Hena1 TaxID=2678601 RepID=A0A6B9JCK6_9CAUD|nr:hypothetical protein HWC84_gp142 [Erwinia phage Hena1]QGZ16372.1 hypothetical protein Hena1_02220 [Erwinia phage Hena1]